MTMHDSSIRGRDREAVVETVERGEDDADRLVARDPLEHRRVLPEDAIHGPV
jgi:hypothetical protein